MDLAPPAYLREIVAYLREQEGALWSWFSSNRFRDEHAKLVRLELLKTTVRLDRETHGTLYAAAGDAAQALDIGSNCRPPTWAGWEEAQNVRNVSLFDHRPGGCRPIVS